MASKNEFCPICCSSKWRLVHIPSRNCCLRECENCGVLIRVSEHGGAERGILNHYKNVDPSEDVSSARTKFFQRLLWVLGNPEPGSKLLDVGCGRGTFLNTARNIGWDVYGVDITPSACEDAKRSYHLDIFCGDLQSARFEKDFFDAVTIIDALMQFPDPGKALDEVARILKPDGVLYLRLKNAKFQIFLNSFFLKFGLILKPLIHRNPAVFHPVNFTIKSLRVLLENNRFSDYRITNSPLTDGDPYKTGSPGFIQFVKWGYEFLSKMIAIGSGNKIFIGASLDVVAKRSFSYEGKLKNL